MTTSTPEAWFTGAPPNYCCPLPKCCACPRPLSLERSRSCEDGGFYLLGLRRCPPGLLCELPWSAPDTFLKTLSRLRDRGLATAVIAPWFDVDQPADLACLRALIARGEVHAPRTARALEAIDRVGRDGRECA